MKKGQLSITIRASMGNSVLSLRLEDIEAEAGALDPLLQGLAQIKAHALHMHTGRLTDA